METFKAGNVTFAIFTDAESEHVDTILDRVQDLIPGANRQSVRMDLSATHAHCRIDFERLAGFDDFNLLHDVGGIAQHIDRSTGLLDEFFLPRCARGEG